MPPKKKSPRVAAQSSTIISKKSTSIEPQGYKKTSKIAIKGSDEQNLDVEPELDPSQYMEGVLNSGEQKKRATKKRPLSFTQGELSEPSIGEQVRKKTKAATPIAPRRTKVISPISKIGRVRIPQKNKSADQSKAKITNKKKNQPPIAQSTRCSTPEKSDNEEPLSEFSEEFEPPSTISNDVEHFGETSIFQRASKHNTTTAHDFRVAVPERKPTSSQIKEVAALIKSDSWPLEKFVEPETGRRGAWVAWATRFKSTMKLAPNATSQQIKSVLLSKGGEAIWDIGGTELHELSLQQLWDKLDRHYAALGNPDLELAMFHAMKQEAGEDFAAFVNKLKKQAIRAEIPETTLSYEIKTSILERSLVKRQLAFHARMMNLDNNELIRLGVDLSEELLVQQQVQELGTKQILAAQQEAASNERARMPTNAKWQRPATSWDDKTRQNENWKGKQPYHTAEPQTCRSCGKRHIGKCVAKQQDKLCFKCAKPGHFARDCKGGGTAPRAASIHQVMSGAHVTDDNWD